jgi:arylsulfatase
MPLEGTSLQYSLGDPEAPTRKETQFYSMLGSRGIYHKGWKANTVHPTIAGWSNYGADVWALYHVDEDRSEVDDLSATHPEKLAELKALWYHEAGKYQGFPLEDRSAVEVLTTPRPQLAPPRDRYVYRPGTAEIPEGAAVNVRNRSFKVAAAVSIDGDDAAGVVFSHGGRFGGHTMFVKDHKLHYVYNWLGEFEQAVVSDIDVPAGDCVLGVSFDKQDTDAQGSSLGTATIFVNDRAAGSDHIKTQPGKFMLAGEGLNVGKDPGSPVSKSGYIAPFTFTGGTIHEVVFDVGGDAYVDLELEALAMMKRD